MLPSAVESLARFQLFRHTHTCQCVLHDGRCLFVCLSVCLSVTHRTYIKKRGSGLILFFSGDTLALLCTLEIYCHR